MTKKDYFRLADAIREALRGVPDMPGGDLLRRGIMATAHEISIELHHDNPNFSEERFFHYIEHGHMKGFGRGSGRGGR